MTVGEQRAAPRFHDAYEPDRRPYQAGLCVTCRRAMWANVNRVAAPKTLTAAADGLHCLPCQRSITHGGDPRDRKGSPAEVIPAERPEHDPGWRDRARCRGLDPELFAPAPLRDELADPAEYAELSDRARKRRRQQHRAQERDRRRRTAETVCAACPVEQECRAAALEHGWEGLWGGLLIHYTWWENLLTGEMGATVNADAREKQAVEARRARAA